jgi:TatD DNase family protein
VYVDAHVHLDRFADPDAVVDAASRGGVHCLAVTETPAHHVVVRAWLGARAGVEVAVGAHPLHAGSLSEVDLRRLDQAIGDCRFVGEVGLDGSPEGVGSLPAQRRAFERVLAHPGLRSRVLTVHSRGADAEAIAALAGARATAVLHWFRGTPADAQAALDAGLRFSVNPAMIATEHGRALISQLPRERVLTETDGPYTSVDGRAATPSDIPVVITALAQAWAVEPERARRQVADNWHALVG